MFKISGKHNSATIFLEESQLDDSTRKQINDMCNNPAYSGNDSIKIMPDTHAGSGSVIGFTMKFEDRIDPRCVGVDIGCQVSIHKTNLHLNDVKNILPIIDKYIKKSIPMGFEINESISEDNKRNLLNFFSGYSGTIFTEKYIESFCKKINISVSKFWNSIGTLGGGNHFIELNIDKENNVWYSIHTGSRNLGVKVCNHHTGIMLDEKTNKEKRKADFKSLIESIRSKYSGEDIGKEIAKAKKEFDLEFSESKEYLSGDDLNNYLKDMFICQMYAKFNHFIISERIEKVLQELTKQCNLLYSIYSMHNYIDMNKNIIRKGSISAKKGEIIVIPLNMRDGIIIGYGKGNPYWNYSAPHGAGRIMSRSQAKENLSFDNYKSSMSGIYSSSVNLETIDEAPFVYKNKDLIINSIIDSVEILEIIIPILSIKSSDNINFNLKRR